jgi:UDP-2,4-diacetamido-2,4,6-trideoxy-beta-L-altropyranose hydrolase
VNRAGVGTLLVRADAGPRAGAGHVMRCLALAQAWNGAGGRSLFVLSEGAGALVDRLGDEGVPAFELREAAGGAADAARTAGLAWAEQAAWVVVDGYCFDEAYRLAVAASGARVVCVDDCGIDGPCGADVVLNQHGHACPELYRGCRADARLLLGTRYAMLRQEFRRWRGRERAARQEPRRVLVTLGGSDPANVTPRVLRALDRVPGGPLEVRVAAGPVNSRVNELRAAAAAVRHQVEVLPHVTDMPALMAWADVAVSAAGFTCWEMAFMGLPAVLVSVAPNQEPIAASLDAAGAARWVGGAANADERTLAAGLAELLCQPTLLNDMACRARELVDGYGAERVARALGAPA